MALPADLGSEAECNRLAAELGEREDEARHPGEQRGRQLGRSHGRIPGRRLGQSALALNVKAIFHLTRALVPQLEAAASDEDPARVINIGSIDGLQVPALETYAYSASKAAVHHLTRVLAKKLAPKRITVNAVAPGTLREQDDGRDPRDSSAT